MSSMRKISRCGLRAVARERYQTRKSLGRIDEDSCEKGVVFLLRDAADPWPRYIMKQARQEKGLSALSVVDVWSLTRAGKYRDVV